MAELDQLEQAGLAELADGLEEAAGEAAALRAGLVLVQQQVAEALLEAVGELEAPAAGMRDRKRNPGSSRPGMRDAWCQRVKAGAADAALG